MAQTDFELQNYLSLIAQEVNDQLEENDGAGFREEAFTQLVADYLTEAQETGNFQICTSIHLNKAGKRQRKINGYSLWDDQETLDLFITDFNGDGQIRIIEKNRLTVAFNLLGNYLRYLNKGDFSQLEDSAAGTEFVSNMQEFAGNLQRIRLIFLTDGIVNQLTPPVHSGHSAEPLVIHEVWDIQRLYQLWVSSGKRELTEINIPDQFGHKIECLTVDQVNDQYTAYLAIIPADLLAGLYDVYGTRLLEQNVRVYLQNLGKVNREIRKTILNNPGMFMAYNNGISATATEISFSTDETGKRFITTVKGLQIVNGGQTTSSIYYARKKDRADLRSIHIQMKITQVHNETKTDQIVAQISKFANSQNKVSEIDLTSNQPFQIALEELSRTTWTRPLKPGDRQTRWFYERVKGQYKEELNKEHTKQRIAQFKLKNPSNHVIRKEELAKFRNCWKMLPYWVARGSQKNYLFFVSAENDSTPDRQYYKNVVANAILYREAEDIYGKKPNSMGDLRYLAVPYSMAWLNHQTDGRLDLAKIWEDQAISPALNKLIGNVLRKVNNFLQQKPDEFALISEWAKREECWKTLSSIGPEEMGIDLGQIADDLKNADLPGLSVTAATGTLSGLSIHDWEKIAAEGQQNRRFDLFQLNIIRNVIRRLKLGQPFTERLNEQAATLLKNYQDGTVDL
ncbi:AIPR family protein [Mucilaginibacter sp. dw_454]|uniref:AIPR family protein n=1 Tax=Mucilaginibacter sp. dw_454 TaxID=2720079 RepID=UPI001BD32965|nr:AIPR family protein [Mucilaginibacter sp. dw_454]